MVSLGVVPFGQLHPQVPRLGEALARSGFAALLYWSPAMRDVRLDPADIGDIASAYEALLARPDVDPMRSGLLGTCVGGAFALMAAADARIRDRVSFVFAYAAYASIWTLVQDIASASRDRAGPREPWAVDPLARNVFVRSMTALLEPGEAQRLRDVCADRLPRGQGQPNLPTLSEAASAILPLLTAPDLGEAGEALQRLPAALRERLDAMSPTRYLGDVVRRGSCSCTTATIR